jgi:hypothetical protein
MFEKFMKNDLKVLDRNFFTFRWFSKPSFLIILILTLFSIGGYLLIPIIRESLESRKKIHFAETYAITKNKVYPFVGLVSKSAATQDSSRLLNTLFDVKNDQWTNRLRVTSLLGVFSGQLVKTSTVKELIVQLNENDARNALRELKTVLEQLSSTKTSEMIIKQPHLFQQLDQKKTELERKFTRFVSFYDEHHLNPSKNLLFTADKAAAIYINRYGGGDYDKDLDLVVPRESSLVQRRWLELKSQIANQIGVISPRANFNSDLWANSAKSVEDLLEDARQAAAQLKPMVKEISAEVTGSKIDFGPHSEHILKSEKSMRDKINRNEVLLNYSNAEAIAYLNDTVRGTLMAKTIDDMLLLIEKFKEKASLLGWDVVFFNHWETEKPFGYVGVHAKMRIPLIPSFGEEQRWILGEMQFHLQALNDGTSHSFKEKQHIIYSIIRNPNTDPVLNRKYSASSMLLYVAAFEEIVRDLAVK